MTVQGKNAIDILLAESFKELALQRPIEKITIKEITNKAGVIRPTFYNHFQDKYELLEWIVEKELLEPILPLLENHMLNEAFALLFANIEKEKNFYIQAVKLEGQNSFEEIAENCVEKILEKVIRENQTGNRPTVEWQLPEYVAGYYAKMLVYITVTWIKKGLPISSGELVAIYDYIMNRSMSDVIYGESENS